jgi:hypothetical protein
LYRCAALTAHATAISSLMRLYAGSSVALPGADPRFLRKRAA